MSRRRLRWAVLALSTGLLCPAPAAALAAGSPSQPTPTQIHAAVAKAKRSPHLWATVNTCNTRRHPDTIGIRAQMPALGFPARLSMAIHVDYWDGTSRTFKPIPGPGTTALDKLGVWSSGYEQGGRDFPFRPHAGLLKATVTFRWRRSGRLLLEVTRQTTAAHHDADHGDPAGYSAATCRIP